MEREGRLREIRTEKYGEVGKRERDEKEAGARGAREVGPGIQKNSIKKRLHRKELDTPYTHLTP